MDININGDQLSERITSIKIVFRLHWISMEKFQTNWITPTTMTTSWFPAKKWNHSSKEWKLERKRTKKKKKLRLKMVFDCTHIHTHSWILIVTVSGQDAYLKYKRGGKREKNGKIMYNTIVYEIFLIKITIYDMFAVVDSLKRNAHRIQFMCLVTHVYWIVNLMKPDGIETNVNIHHVVAGERYYTISDASTFWISFVYNSSASLFFFFFEVY